MKCASCGGALAFDPRSGKVHCAHCGQYFEAESLRPDNDDGVEACQDTMGQDIYTCASCGARVMVNDVESATYCIYCGQPAVVVSRITDMKKPQSIVPFSVTKEQAHEIIRKRLRRGSAVPESIKNFSPDMVRGIYIPFRKYDVDYHAKNIVKATKPLGLWTLLVGIWGSMVPTFQYSEGIARYQDITVDASLAFNDHSAHKLEPYDLSKRKPFHVGYMLGFYGDCYDESGRDLEEKAVLRCRELYEAELTRKAKGNAEVTDSNYCAEIKNDEYIMLPVWFAVFHENGQHYTLMVNGQTGKIVGTVPFERKKAAVKTALLCFLISCIPIALLVLVFYNQIKGSTFWYELSQIGGIFLLTCWIYPVPFIVLFYRVHERITDEFDASLGLTRESEIKHLAADRQGTEK